MLSAGRPVEYSMAPGAMHEWALTGGGIHATPHVRARMGNGSWWVLCTSGPAQAAGYMLHHTCGPTQRSTTLRDELTRNNETMS